MANPDTPNGFWASRHAHGGRIIASMYLAGSATDIFIGDAVKMEADGDVVTASAGDTILGVAANFTTADQDEVWVYDDPGIIFRVQHDGTPAQADMGQLYDLLATTGDTTTQRSKHELDTSTNTDGSATFRMLDKVDNPDNAWGLNVDVYVEIVEHQRSRKYDSALAGI